MTTNEAQIAYWNDQAAVTWVQMQPLLDLQLAPLGARALAALAPAPGERVLDIGCGCGASTQALAERVSPGGSVLGVDISGPMLAQARRASASIGNVDFAQLDAQVARFDTAFDAAFSRFGVMFFADPAAAFTNIRAALRQGGRLTFVCWRAPAENPWMMAPFMAALRFVPPPPPSDPLEPGPFAFADSIRVEGILAQAGFHAISIRPFDALVGGAGLDDALKLALRVGPLGKMLREAPEHLDSVVGAVRETLSAHMTDGKVWLPSATWIVTATA